jgi:putative methyltransferase (TIGR04325 family)
MEKIKRILKSVTPPIVYSFFKRILIIRKNNFLWQGSYLKWQDAQSNCLGYSSEEILDKCRISMLRIINGDAVYERDSELFDEIQYSWCLIAGLQKAIISNNGKLCVLDFGGSLGSSYYQNRNFIGNIKSLEWCIVEQPHFVECGKQNFENDQLFFYYTLEECLAKHKPNVLLLSSVLQYLENPYAWINTFLALEIDYILIDRTAFIDKSDDIITIQSIPQKIYSSSYPAWFFNESSLIKAFANYKVICSFKSYCDKDIELNGNSKGEWKGHLLIKNS